MGHFLSRNKVSIVSHFFRNRRRIAVCFALSLSLLATHEVRELHVREDDYSYLVRAARPESSVSLVAQDIETTNTTAFARFISVYYINLNTRSDRRRAIEAQLAGVGVPVERVEAVDIRQNEAVLRSCWDPSLMFLCAGKIGCKESHIKALQMGEMSGARAVAIFEDDFEWLPGVDASKLGAILDVFNKKLSNWDVIGLSLNIKNRYVTEPQTEIDTGAARRSLVVRVTEAQTTHGYVVKLSYIPRLMEKFRLCNVHERIDVAIDQCWKPLQLHDNWYGLSPQLGVQTPGYSDIEHRDVNYSLGDRR